jgi:hypothetical protein
MAENDGYVPEALLNKASIWLWGQNSIGVLNLTFDLSARCIWVSNVKLAPLGHGLMDELVLAAGLARRYEEALEKRAWRPG